MDCVKEKEKLSSFTFNLRSKDLISPLANSNNCFIIHISVKFAI